MSYQIPEWAKAPPDATTPRLLSSYDKAIKSDSTPRSVDKEAGTANFAGKHGNYFTTLQGCPCGSFPKPCKHMYRLAMELDIMPAALAHDHAVAANRFEANATGFTREAVRSLIDTLDENAQRFLFHFSGLCYGLAGENYRFLPRSSEIDELISRGLLMENTQDPVAIPERFVKDTVRAVLSAAGISLPDAVLKKNSRYKKDAQFLRELYAQCPDTMRTLFAIVDGTAALYTHRGMICRYLAPKFETWGGCMVTAGNIFLSTSNADEAFSCCSRYRECSDAGCCLIADQPRSAACAYRKNLELGNIFYGKRSRFFSMEYYAEFREKCHFTSSEDQYAFDQLVYHLQYWQRCKRDVFLSVHPLYLELEAAGLLFLDRSPRRILSLYQFSYLKKLIGDAILPEWKSLKREAFLDTVCSLSELPPTLCPLVEQNAFVGIPTHLRRYYEEYFCDELLCEHRLPPLPSPMADDDTHFLKNAYL